jgi:hypothetical protein
VLRAGARSVPPELIAAAREAKAELSKVINSPKVLDSGEVEHLPRSEKQTARVSAASIEGAQLCESERLPVCLSTFNQSRNDYSAAEALTEDAHLSTLEQGGDFSGSQCDPVSKALNSPHVSGFERDGHLHPNWDDVEEERAAIVELDGEILRDWADGFARLDPARPPGDVPPRRWRQFVDDVGLFLDAWAARAAALGWSPHELFGCDRDRPFARIDQAGLVWLLNGGKLIALSESTATIEIRDGERHTRRRRPTDPGRVLAWELTR